MQLDLEIGDLFINTWGEYHLVLDIRYNWPDPNWKYLPDGYQNSRPERANVSVYVWTWDLKLRRTNGYSWDSIDMGNKVLRNFREIEAAFNGVAMEST